jgi:hypothetical protein
MTLGFDTTASTLRTLSAVSALLTLMLITPALVVAGLF